MIHTLGKSGHIATKTFRTFESGAPDLVPTGLPPIDRLLGGLFPGSAGTLGAAQGVGKSSLVLSALFNAAARGIPMGYLSLEDTPDVVGSRALAALSGVNSLKIRTKQLSEDEKGRIRGVEKKLESLPIFVAYEVGSNLEEAASAIEKLGEAGCRMVWVDYLQKVRGHNGDRRNEVSTTFTRLQNAADKAKAAVMFISQFSRQDPTKTPQVGWLKESGDIENESRLIILMHRSEKLNKHGNFDLHARIAKSTFGGEGQVFTMTRDSSGTLREAEEVEETDF